jgi:hypothetical protein
MRCTDSYWPKGSPKNHKHTVTRHAHSIIRDAIVDRYRFVMSVDEMVWKYPGITTGDLHAANRFIVLCKDGMIRPR